MGVDILLVSAQGGRECNTICLVKEWTCREHRGQGGTEYKQGFGVKTSLSNKNMLDFMGIYSVRIKTKQDTCYISELKNLFGNFK